MEMKSPEVAFCSSVNLCGTNREQIFRLPKSSWTMVCTVSLLMSNSTAINLNVSHRSCANLCRTFSIITFVNTFSAHGFPPVHLQVHFTGLRCSFPQFVAERDVCTLLHCVVTTSHTDYVQLSAVGLHCRSHAVHVVCRFSPCLLRTMRMRHV